MDRVGCLTEVKLLPGIIPPLSLSVICVFTVLAQIMLTQDRQRRSVASVKTEIVTEITVKKDSNRIDFKTVMTNKSKDHMLVVDFPTETKAKTADWEAPFEIRQREIDNFSNINGVKGPEGRLCRAL